MTKLVLITDTHWGVRGDNVAFLDNNKKFLDEVFFPYVDGNNISTVIHLGDLVDRRKYININTARRLRVDFLDKLKLRNLEIHLIAGNHDTYFKNTNDDIVIMLTFYLAAAYRLFPSINKIFVSYQQIKFGKPSIPAIMEYYKLEKKNKLLCWL